MIRKATFWGIAFIAGAVGGPVASHAIAVAHADKPVVQKWEQWCTSQRFSGEVDKAIARVNEEIKRKGDEGWELASGDVAVDAGLFVSCFKRPAR
jgi:hypothetical protein